MNSPDTMNTLEKAFFKNMSKIDGYLENEENHNALSSSS